MTPEELARACAGRMWELDASRATTGLSLIDVGPGRASMSMRVRPDMLNGYGICHGGFIFLLADSTFAYACNSRDVSTVAQHCLINFLAPGRENDLLTATAREVNLAGRSGVYDVAVTRHNGDAIAEFRGMSRAVGGGILNAGT